MANKIIIGPGRLSYPNIFTPQKNDRGEDRWSTVLLLPPDYDLKPLKEALTKAMKEKFGNDPEKWPSKCRKPQDVIAPAEEKYGSAFKGWFAVSSSGVSAPGVVDANVDKVTDKSEAYPGRWAKVSAAAYAYDNKTKGVTLGLNNVQILRHDEAIAGKPRAEDEFEAVAAEMAVSEEWA